MGNNVLAKCTHIASWIACQYQRLIMTVINLDFSVPYLIFLMVSWLIETYCGCRTLACSVSLLEKSSWAFSIPRLLRDVSGYADQAERISSCQCDLIKKAPFHFFVFIKLCNCYCFSPTPSPGAQVWFFLSVYYYIRNLSLLSRAERSIPRSLQFLSSCVKDNDRTAALHHWLGSLRRLSLGHRDRYYNTNDKSVCIESHGATQTMKHVHRKKILFLNYASRISLTTSRPVIRETALIC